MANKKTKSKKQNELKKSVKKVNKKYLILFIFFALIGIGIGAGTMFYFTKDDTFKLVGEREIVLYVGDSYLEEGVTCVSFGKDISDTIVPTGKVDTSQVGIYVIKYSTKDIRYKRVTLYRKITVIAKGENANV